MPQKQFVKFFLPLLIASLNFNLAVAYAESSTPNAPAFIEVSQQGLENTDTNAEFQVRVWLKFRNEDQLSSLAQSVIDPSATQFQKWLNQSEALAKFSPSMDDVPPVLDYLVANGFRIDSVEPHGFWVLARGSNASVQKAFKFGLHDAVVDGKLVKAVNHKRTMGSTEDYVLAGELKPSHTVVPVSDSHLTPEADTSDQDPPATITSGTYTNQCFNASETHDFSAADKSLTATYSGNRFVGDPKAEDAIALSSCGYDPATLQKAYGFDKLQQAGLDGSGQTLVIINSFGSHSARQDLNSFSKKYDLPKAKLDIYYPDGGFTGPFTGFQQQWAKETALDIEIAHVVAPATRIALVGSYMDEDGKPMSGLAWAIINHIGDVISDSSSDTEEGLAPAKLALMESILKLAVVQGISVQAASGDSGNLAGAVEKNGKYAGYPASSPFITAVGGTTLAVQPDGSMWFQLGWGDNMVQLTSDAQTPLNPPGQAGTLGSGIFQMGAGGGTSKIFSKPVYQNSLNGNYRKVPDISYLADPFTGAQLILTKYDANGNLLKGDQVVRIQGGTSLSSPMFSALWTIANQKARHSLGLASAAVYRLPKNAISDVRGAPSSLSVNNVSGSIKTAAGSTVNETADMLASPPKYSPYLSTLFLSPALGSTIDKSSWWVLSFGTDSTLRVEAGWDDVTGLGTPNAEAFVKESAELR